MILIGIELQIACVQKQLPNPLTHNAQSFLIQTVQSTGTFFGLIIKYKAVVIEYGGILI